jgi:hypothetical protein
MSEPLYRSSKLGPIPVRSMAVPHAARVLASLPADADPDLRAALEARAALDGSTVEPRAVPFGDPSGAVLRGSDGRFVAAVSRSRYRSREAHEPGDEPAREPLGRRPESPRAGEFTRSPSGRMMTEQTNELLPPSGRTKRGCRS